MSFLIKVKNLIKTPSINIKSLRSSSKIVRSTDVVIRGDVIGQPNPVSNIRPITFHIPHNETALERDFRLQREQVQNWHEEFWKHHNTKFMKERKQFIESLHSGKLPERKDVKGVTADEISVFYKSFLDKYWKTHIWYNFEWYKRNINLLVLAFRVEMERLQRKLL